MAAAPTVQRETIALTGPLLAAVLLRGLPARDEGRKAFGVSALVSRGCLLRLWSSRLMLLMMLITIAIVRLCVARRVRLLARRIGLLLAAHVATALARLLILAFCEIVARAAVALRLIVRIRLPELLLGCRDHAEIMFGVLVIVFGRDRIARSLRVAGKLQVFFRDCRRRTTDFHLRAIRLVHPRQRILTLALVVVLLRLLIVPPAHPLILTVSHHGSPVANS
jgi:hypothetical protein